MIGAWSHSRPNPTNQSFRDPARIPFPIDGTSGNLGQGVGDGNVGIGVGGGVARRRIGKHAPDLERVASELLRASGQP
jgi:hypothetical protein